mgnify:CR=1 FL=1
MKKVNLKTIVWAPFEQPTKNISVKREEFPNARFLSFDEIQKIGDKSVLKAPEKAKPDTIAVTMYTSGTSGKPKGVLISQSNLVAACSGIGERLMVGKRFSPEGRYHSLS